MLRAAISYHDHSESGALELIDHIVPHERMERVGVVKVESDGHRLCLAVKVERAEVA